MLEKRNWAKDTRGEILAYKHLASVLKVKYNVKFGFGVNPVNYAHKVWRKNRRKVDTKDIVSYQDSIETYINSVKRSLDYKDLLAGTATPMLILDTMLRYKLVKKCGG